MKLDSEKPTLADMFRVAEKRAKPSKKPDEKTEKPEWEIKARPTGGLKPDGFRAEAKLRF